MDREMMDNELFRSTILQALDEGGGVLIMRPELWRHITKGAKDYFQQFAGIVDRSRFYVWYDGHNKRFELRSRDNGGTTLIWLFGQPYEFLASWQFYGSPKTAAEAWEHLPE